MAVIDLDSIVLVPVGQVISCFTGMKGLEDRTTIEQLGLTRKWPQILDLMPSPPVGPLEIIFAAMPLDDAGAGADAVHLGIRKPPDLQAVFMDKLLCFYQVVSPISDY
jgi:hypothetical protein